MSNEPGEARTDVPQYSSSRLRGSRRLATMSRKGEGEEYASRREPASRHAVRLSATEQAGVLGFVPLARDVGAEGGGSHCVEASRAGAACGLADQRFERGDRPLPVGL